MDDRKKLSVFKPGKQEFLGRLALQHHRHLDGQLLGKLV
jgi:hypothetical protein